MRRFMLLAVLAAVLPGIGCEPETCSTAFTGYDDGDGCLTDEEIRNIGNVPPISVTPTAAKLAVGQSAVFQVAGGLEPLTVQVMGCLFGVTSCVPYAIDTEHNPATRAFLIEYSGKDRRTIRVTFLTRENRPTYASLYVFGRNRIGDQYEAVSALVPIELVD